MQRISWRLRGIHYVDRCRHSPMHHSSLRQHFGRFQEWRDAEKKKKKKKSKAIKTVCILGSVLCVCLISQTKPTFVSGSGDSPLNPASRRQRPRSRVSEVLPGVFLSRAGFLGKSRVFLLRYFRGHGNARTSSSGIMWRPIASRVSVDMPATATSQNSPSYI